MSRSRASSRRRSPRPAKRWAEWALVRSWAALFALVADWLSKAEPGRFRTHWLRLLRRDLGKLEQILRCLLLIMRPPRAAPKPAPRIFMRPGLKPAGRIKRRPARFSVTLRNFSWYTPQPVAPPSVNRSSARQARTREDPVAALQSRLAALRAVFADPGPHAARIAAACRARGLCPRRGKTWLPLAEFWSIASERVHAPGFNPARASTPPSLGPHRKTQTHSPAADPAFRPPVLAAA